MELYSGCFASNEILSYLDNIEFDQNVITMYGKIHNIPRLEKYFGDKDYYYSGIRLKNNRFPQWLKELQKKVMDYTGFEFNVCLINKYRDGNDYVAWHSDDEISLGPEPCIVSISIGETRNFKLKSKIDNTITSLNLNHGDMLVMLPGVQENYYHTLVKSKRVKGTRYSLTFRYIK